MNSQKRNKIIKQIYTSRSVARKPSPQKLPTPLKPIVRQHHSPPKVTPYENRNVQQQFVKHSKTMMMRSGESSCKVGDRRKLKHSIRLPRFTKIRESTESIMKELELSGNEDVSEINRGILQSSQEFQKKINENFENYINNIYNQVSQRQKNNNLFFDNDLDNSIELNRRYTRYWNRNLHTYSKIM